MPRRVPGRRTGERVAPERVDAYFRHRSYGMSQREASRRVGIGRMTAQVLDREMALRARLRWEERLVERRLGGGG
jgi:hypothetical protein